MLELEGKCGNGYLDYTCPSVHYTLASCATKHDLRKLCLDLILVMTLTCWCMIAWVYMTPVCVIV